MILAICDEISELETTLEIVINKQVLEGFGRGQPARTRIWVLIPIEKWLLGPTSLFQNVCSDFWRREIESRAKKLFSFCTW